MKKGLFLSVFITFVLSSCAGDDGGTFTLVDIPKEYHGKYAMVTVRDTKNNLFMQGVQSIDMATETIVMCQISNGGRVNIPMWIINMNDQSITRYNGNHTVNGLVVGIFENALNIQWTLIMVSFNETTFSRGNATKSWNDSFVFEY
jgi:hypothetical protein